MYSLSTLNEVFEPGYFPTLVYSAKQEYGKQRHDRPMHKHDSLCELLLCYRGFGTYQVESHSYTIQRGSVIFGNVGELHEVVSDYETEIGTYCFGIQNVYFRGMPLNTLIPEGSSHVRNSGSLFPLFESMCEQVDRLYAGNVQERLTAQLMLGSLVLLAHRLPDEPRPRGSVTNSQLAIRAKEYIDAHYTEDITLESISEALGCSVPYLSHVFKDVSGYSPIQYVIRRRIGLAQTWLISSDLSATQIAIMVGYDNTNYFNTLFKRTVGVSPIQYRKQYLESLRGKRDQK